MYFKNLFYIDVTVGPVHQRALVDTGACQSAMSKFHLDKILLRSRSSIKKREEIPNDYVRVANGHQVKIHEYVDIELDVCGSKIIEKFMVFSVLHSVILGAPFFKNNQITIDLANHRLTIPDQDITLQLNQIMQRDGKPVKTYKKNTYPVVTETKLVIGPNEQRIIFCHVERGDNEDRSEKISGIVEPNVRFEVRSDICVTSSISKEDDKGKFPIGVINLTGNTCTIPPRTLIGKFKVLTQTQIEFLTPIDPEVLNTVKRHAATREEVDNAITSIYQLDKPRYARKSINLIDEQEGREFWFPTPETCSDPSRLNDTEKAIYDAIAGFKKQETLNPENSEEDRKTFLSNFPWDRSMLNQEERKRLEELLVRYHGIFARHRLDIGQNTDFSVKLTPMNDEPMYSHGHPTPLHLRKEMIVELSLMQYYGIIRSLPFSKHASPIFAQRKPNGNLRILIDLRRVNNLIRHDYDSHNFPISSLADVGGHLAGKKYFCKLDCSQAFHVVRMADIESIQLLAFNFEGRTYAFQRLAQGLNRSVTSFGSFMRKYLDPCIASGRCFQYVDDVGTAGNTGNEMIDNVEAIFICIQKSGMKLTMKKCEFGVERINFLGNTISSKGVTPNCEKVKKFLDALKMPKNPKQVKRLIGFLQFFRSFLPHLSIKLLEFYKLLRKDVPFIINDIHKENFNTLREDLLRATELYLTLPVPDKQYVILTDASFYGAGYVLMIEDSSKVADGEDKILAPVSFGSRAFSPAQLKMSTHSKEFLAVYYAFDQFSHLLWGATEKKVLVLTDNKSLARFFHSKMIPAPLWNFLDRLMSHRFVLGHIPGRANAAADYLSRMQLDPGMKIKLRMSESIPLHKITMDIYSQTPSQLNAVTQEEPDNFDYSIFDDTQSQELDQPLDATPDQKLLLMLSHTYKLLIGDPDLSEVTRLYEFVKSNPKTINSLNATNPLDTFPLDDAITASDIKSEQNKDSLIRKVKEWVKRGQQPVIPYPSVEETKYLKQLPRLVIREGILERAFYNNAGEISHYQTVIPKHLRKELIYRMHNSKLQGHVGVGTTIAEFRKRYYFPGFSEFLRDYIVNCQTCQQVKPIRQAQLTPPLQQVMSEVELPGDMMQIDLVGKLDATMSGFKFILTGIDVFTRYLFAIPLRKVDAVSVAKALMSIFLKHSYIPVVILTDMGSVFVSRLFQELTKLLEIQLNHASVKHSQTVGTIERSHAALKKVLKIYENNKHTDWDKYLDYAVFAHNTTYHSSIRTTPSMVFHGREPLTPLDLRFRSGQIANAKTNYSSNAEVKNFTSDLYQTTRENAIISYLKYSSFYDKKALAQPLKLHSYCLLLDPRLTGQDKFTKKSDAKWIALFRVEKVLTNMNYIVRKTGTMYTQCVHRIRLRPIVPQYKVPDIDVPSNAKFTADPVLTRLTSEPTLFDDCLPHLLYEAAEEIEKEPDVTEEEMECLLQELTNMEIQPIRRRAVPAPAVPAAPVAPVPAAPAAPVPNVLRAPADPLEENVRILRPMAHRRVPQDQLPIIVEAANENPFEPANLKRPHDENQYEDMELNPNVIYDIPGGREPPRRIPSPPRTPPRLIHEPQLPPETPRLHTEHGKKGRILPQKRLSFEDALGTPAEPGTSSNYGPVTRSQLPKHPAETLGGPRTPGTPYVLPEATPAQREQMKIMTRKIKKPSKYNELLRHSYGGPYRAPPKQ